MNAPGTYRALMLPKAGGPEVLQCVELPIEAPKGPVLLTGDTSHTRWGWEHGVEPGSYTADQPTNLKSLQMLEQLVKRHPAMDVRFGHLY